MDFSHKTGVNFSTNLKYNLEPASILGGIDMAKTINLDFRGYWREVNKSGIPTESGIYAVYVCKYNPKPKDTVAITKLIYIGEAKDVNDRISKHEKWTEWREEVPSTFELCFSFAKVSSPDRERAECALIYHHKPTCNDECKDSFPYEDTTVVSAGRHKFIKSPITVKKTT